jgi:hypothetical protein
MVKKIKQRPRRLFYDDKTKRYFYLINNKKKYIKVPEGSSAKAIARVNIQNVLPVPVRRKAVRPRASIKPITNEPVVPKLVPIAPIAQNLISEKYSIYKAKDELEKKFAKLEETQKAQDAKKEEEKKTEGKKKGLFSNLFKPTKAPKPTSASVLMAERLDTEKQILKDAEQQKIQAEKDKQDKDAVNKGMNTTNPNPDVEDEGDISTEPTGLFGKVGELFTGKKKPKKNIKVQDFIDKSYSYTIEGVFPPYEWFQNEYSNLTGYNKPSKNVYNEAKDLYNSMKPSTQPPPNTTPIEDLKSENEPANIGLVRTGNITTFGGLGAFYKLNGYGDYENDDDGIFNDELQEIFKDKMNKFLPVIASNKMNTLLPLVNTDTKKFGWIQNTEPSSSMGRHWVAYFIDVPNMEVNYYDSLVENDGIPPKESMKGLKKIIDKIHPEYYLKFKYSTIRDQHPSSKNCGYFALKFIMDRYRNVPFKSASGYDKVYEDYGSGEEMIKRFKKYL